MRVQHNLAKGHSVDTSLDAGCRSIRDRCIDLVRSVNQWLTQWH